MVHNGIEYGDMQLICEAYALLQRVLGLSAEELHEVFTRWNEGELNSFLIEITADIFARRDDKSDGALVDMILDKAGSKGHRQMDDYVGARSGRGCFHHQCRRGSACRFFDERRTRRGLQGVARPNQHAGF
jgi:6-phosphogluconate dehydrogenase